MRKKTLIGVVLPSGDGLRNHYCAPRRRSGSWQLVHRPVHLDFSQTAALYPAARKHGRKRAQRSQRSLCVPCVPSRLFLRPEPAPVEIAALRLACTARKHGRKRAQRSQRSRQNLTPRRKDAKKKTNRQRPLLRPALNHPPEDSLCALAPLRELFRHAPIIMQKSPSLAAVPAGKIPLKSGQPLCYLADESRRPVGRSRPRRRPADPWQFAFCAPESRVRKAGLLFTCYRGKTPRLVPACDRRTRESCDQSSPGARGNRPLVAHLRRTAEILLVHGSPWNVQGSGPFRRQVVRGE